MKGIKKKQGPDRQSGLFLASCFHCLHDPIQKFQFLTCGTVQTFDSLHYGSCVDVGYPSGQFCLTFRGFGRMYDQIDGCHSSDKCHLPGNLSKGLEIFKPCGAFVKYIPRLRRLCAL